MGFTYRQGNEERLSIAQMDNNFLYAEEQISSATASIATLNTNLASATASIATLNTNLASATASIATLNTNLASATASIATLNTNVAAATASIATLNTNLASATASIATLNTNLASATASIATLNTNLASATASIATLTSGLASATASMQYSTAETIVGSWIDNKPIYRRVYEVSATGGSYSMTDLHLSISLKSFIDLRVLVKDTFGSGNYQTSKETSLPGLNQIMVIPSSVASTTPGFSVRCYNNDLSTPLTLNIAIILEYTKTTD
jgi:uncharacterized coiled-coil protein SlyX